MQNPNLAVIKLGTTLSSLKDHRGDFEDWVLAGAALAREDAMVVDPRAGDRLPDVESLAGAVLTGFHAMVTEPRPWSEATASWLREAVDARLPVLGICYGHQLLAHALGGEVGPNPLGPQFGTVMAQIASCARRDRLFGGFGDAIAVQTSHVQSVLVLPHGACVLAASTQDPHLAFVVGDRAWGVQFRPEFDVEVTRAYVHENRYTLIAARKEPADLIAACRASPRSAQVLGRFVHLIAESTDPR